MEISAAEAPAFPMARNCPFDPPPQLVEFQKTEGPKPVRMWDGRKVWIVTRYDDVRQVLGDRRFSSMPSNFGFPMLSPARSARLAEPPTFLRMDPPEHGHFRRMLTREFVVKRIDALRPRIQQTVDDLLAKLEQAGPPADFVEGLSLPLSSQVIADMLGVPYADHHFFQEKSRVRIRLDVDPAVQTKAASEIMAYLDGLLRERERNPDNGEDLLSRLIIDQVAPGHLAHDDAVRMADLLLIAGHETTANQIALGICSFLVNPDQRDLLVAQPDLLNRAVDEMLRFHSIVQYNGARATLEDVEVGGVTIRKGEGVYALISLANRDPAAFECPDRFDITRQAGHHVAFSYGVHQCLGQALARAELQAVFGTLFQRMPGLRLAKPIEEIPFKTGGFVYGVEALPLAW